MIQRLVTPFLLAACTTLAVLSCSDETPFTPMPTALTVMFQGTDWHTIRPTRASHSLLPGNTVDSIVVSRVRVSIRNWMLRGNTDSLALVAQPRVIDLGDSPANRTVDTKSIGTGKYHFLDLVLHRPPVNASTLPEYSGAVFAEFIEGNRFSLIVDGVAYAQFARANFTLKCRTEILSRLALPQSLPLNAGNAMTLTVKTNLASWFRSNGTLLDPVDPANELAIYQNIADSFSLNAAVQ